MIRLRLDLAYDGTAFAGWAKQPGLRTVEAVLEEALATILRTGPRGVPTPRVTVAGRTDAGVHARGQVAHVDIEDDALQASRGRGDRPLLEALVARLSGVLPPDLVVHRATDAPDGFDARFSAIRRRYTYRLCDDTTARDPLARTSVVWHRRTLDVEAMQKSAEPLVGLHDFAAFCKPREGATTIRTLEVFTWSRDEAGLVVADVQADAFCHSMVRSLVGASLAVGEGRRGTDWPGLQLAGRSRDGKTHVAPAHGLTLEEVSYPPDQEMADRAALTRARRSVEQVAPACC
ncbi:tRNA pseudouridine(38-40) synthase TruA [Cellulomonas rhizosphaerae]|uniref:tRNA pseudouridine synthase A n=1 Tax=Cellulomonas rhizosphaerae TaxID=2293719 RepID=A0A413RK42_9CELL|nr:tRNA pseudouridine(38-40) synthase TruA [Cellulomonas rhizosphaerae]RHA39156.1 tRNA pseudouridine(38-40) synthase TruA [Cellulomonas rhizosphaerae]